MHVEILERRARIKASNVRRAQYVEERAIPDAITKLDHLLAEAQRRDIPIKDDWRWRMEGLRSRYLTDPKLVNQAWEREVENARKSR